jgi:hypothetical protein
MPRVFSLLHTIIPWARSSCSPSSSSEHIIPQLSTPLIAFFYFAARKGRAVLCNRDKVTSFMLSAPLQSANLISNINAANNKLIRIGMGLYL